MKERYIQKPYLGLSHIFVVQSLSHVWLFVAPWTIEWTPCPSPFPRDCLNSCPLSQWCHPTISSSVVPFSSCPQSFPASGSFPMSQLFASGGWSIEASASSSVLPMNIQDWFPLELTALISLQSKGLSRVFSNTAAQKQQFFGAQPSLSFPRNSQSPPGHHSLSFLYYLPKHPLDDEDIVQIKRKTEQKEHLSQTHGGNSLLRRANSL